MRRFDRPVSPSSSASSLSSLLISAPPLQAGDQVDEQRNEQDALVRDLRAHVQADSQQGDGSEPGQHGRAKHGSAKVFAQAWAVAERQRQEAEKEAEAKAAEESARIAAEHDRAEAAKKTQESGLRHRRPLGATTGSDDAAKTAHEKTPLLPHQIRVH